MRLVHLYLRSRRAAQSVAYLAGLAMLAWLSARHNLLLPRLPGDKGTAVPVVFLITLAAAVVIGVSTYSPFGETEQTASYPLPAIKLGHLLGLLVWGAMTLVVAASTWEEPYGELVLLRNLIGFAGLALLSIPLVGSRSSWVLPLVFGLLTFRLGSLRANAFPWWAWPLQPPQHRLAATLALVLLVFGLACACCAKGRTSAREAE